MKKDKRMVDDLISVIIPVYNISEYLNRCIDSVISNTYQKLQIICIDDGSTDGSGEILDEYKKKDQRILVIHKKNGGLSSARNAGLDAACGEYIAYIDGDDWVHPCFFEYMMEVMKAEHADVVDTGYQKTYGEELNENVAFQYKAVDNGDIIKLGYCWRRLYRYDLIKDIRFRNIQIEDIIYNMEILCSNKNLSMFFVDAPLYAYYQREASLSKAITYEGEMEWMRVFLKYAEKEKHTDFSEKLITRVRKRALSIRYSESIQGNQNAVKACNSILRTSLHKKYNLDYKYIVFYAFPFTYRLFRIITDPSMLDAEKNIKTALSNNKK